MCRGVLWPWWLALVLACSEKTQRVEIPAAPMVEVPAGLFLMGCVPAEGRECPSDAVPAREVYVSGFLIDRTEVTLAAYRRCQEVKVCGKGRPQGDDPNLPMTGVTWHDADRYCRWVGRRLPTEAEWEKAARGTDGRSFPWGEAPPDCKLLHHDTATRCISSLVAPVGIHPLGASPSGALDLAGNAGEWTADWYNPQYYQFGPRENPTGDATDRSQFGRVVRGSTDFDELEVYHRRGDDPTESRPLRGFRCARSLPFTP